MTSLIFYGTPEIAAISLARILEESDLKVVAVITQPDRRAGRKQIITPSPVKVLATERGIPVLQPERIKRSSTEFVRSLQAFGDIDIAVVVAFGQILPTEVLSAPRAGSINLHASLLPRWRGAAPIQRAIMAGDAETGVCLMNMEAGLDTGAVYAEEHITISESDDAKSLHDKIASVGARLIVDKIRSIACGEMTARPQSTIGVTYAEKITDADALIDWTRTSKQISCTIRGLSPHPGAHTFLSGKRLKLFSCTATEGSAFSAGEIAAVNRDSISIRCGEGTLIVREVQIEGKKRVAVEEFLRGFPVLPGTILGK